MKSLFVSLGWLMWGTAYALEAPRTPQGFVNDYAGVLRPDESRSLERFLRTVRDSSSNEIAVAIFPSLDGEDLEDFTGNLARQWGVGGKTHQNGVLVAVFVRERKVRIEVGYGLESAIPDAVAKRIIADHIAPAFKRGQYYQGLAAGAQALAAAAVGEYQIKNVKKSERFSRRDWTTAIIVIVVFILLIRYFSRRGGGGGGYGGGGGWFFIPTGGWGGGYGGGWGGDSGSSFGGFGGGDFGGGGASGDW
jgi:uncharacterized protein